MPMIPLLGFVPDLPRTTPGAIVDCSNLIPSSGGFEPAPSRVGVMGLSALPATCRNAMTGENTQGVRRVFAGTETKLYNYVASAWDDVSRAGSYTLASDGRWSFAQFGDYTIAANGASVLQQASSGDFTDIATAPTAAIVVSVANFVIAFDTVDATYGTRPDAWWCSGLFDHTTWAPSLATQANTGRLVATGGPITAALAFGEQCVAYKERAMWLGSYVGGDVVWQWQQIQGDIGCVGQDAVCDAQGVHFFVGDDNIWMYDGVRPRAITEGSVRQWFIDNSSPTYRYRTIVSFDKRNNRLWVFFPNQNSENGRPNSALVFHVPTGKWGRADQEVEAVLTFAQPSTTIDGLNSVAATIDELPAISFDSQYWTTGSRSFAVFDSAGDLQTLTGIGGSSTLTVADFGSDAVVSHLSELRLTFDLAPESSTCAGSATMGASGSPMMERGVGNLNNGVYKIRQSGRWHSVLFNFNGPVKVLGYDYVLRPAGKR